MRAPKSTGAMDDKNIGGTLTCYVNFASTCRAREFSSKGVRIFISELRLDVPLLFLHFFRLSCEWTKEGLFSYF